MKRRDDQGRGGEAERPARRVRRSPEQARAEILEAAEGALREADLSALSVELLMERTGMTRSLFYHYFRSLDDVTLALFERVENEVSGAVDAWLDGDGGEEPRAATVVHLTRMYEVWREHVGLMRAMENAAGRGGRAWEQWRVRVVEHYVAKTSAFVRRQIALGRCTAPDPDGLARALVLMNLAVATDHTARSQPASPVRLGAIVGRVWNGAILGEP